MLRFVPPVFLAAWCTVAPAAQQLQPVVSSFDGKVTIRITTSADGQLTWSATLDGRPVIESSHLGIRVNPRLV